MGTPTVYCASRFSSGNMIFRDRIRLEPDMVVFVKNHWIGNEEHTVRYEQISSISINRGVFFADLLFETTGGSEPLFLNGIWNGKAERAKNDLEARRKLKVGSQEDRVIELLEEQNELLRTIASRLKT